MKINDYQKQALSTDSFPRSTRPVPVTDMAFIAKILGLTGEAGEAAEKVKKIIRNNDGKMSKAERLELIKELGDVLWYVAALSDYLGVELSEVARNNLEKLSDRKNRGVIASKGDNR